MQSASDWQCCRTCKTDKPLTEFWLSPENRSGHQTECKGCGTARNRRWVENNRARFQELNRAATNKRRRRGPLKALISAAKSRCKKSGMEFTITESDIFIPEYCPILGMKLTFGMGQGWGQKLVARDTSVSLDRIDNTKGYIPGNVVVVSYRANRIKSDATVSELLKVARFYAKLEADKRRGADVSGVQQPKEKEECQMP